MTQVLTDISQALQKGRTKLVCALIAQALAKGVDANDILAYGLLAGMEAMAEQFKNDEVYVPEILVSMRAMNAGAALLKPHLNKNENLSDLGINLARKMLESKGVEVRF
jgi:methanogenic corrinoid protein MtbC1